MTVYYVSIPFLSGRERSHSDAHRPLLCICRCFNPLLIGAGALPKSCSLGEGDAVVVSIPFLSGRERSPMMKAAVAAAMSAFQSPSYRGGSAPRETVRDEGLGI